MENNDLYQEEQISVQKEIKRQLENSAIIPIPKFPKEMKAKIVNEITAKIVDEVEINDTPFKQLSEELAKEFKTLAKTVAEAIVENAPEPVTEVKVKNLKEARTEATDIKPVVKGLANLAKVIIENKPIVNVEKQEITFPNRARDYVSVRLTDGKQFYDSKSQQAAGVTHVGDPLAGFQPNDQDTSSNPRYFGFSKANGSWYIMEENTSNGTFRYATGSPLPNQGGGLYTDAWTNRANLTYDYFHEVF